MSNFETYTINSQGVFTKFMDNNNVRVSLWEDVGIGEWFAHVSVVDKNNPENSFTRLDTLDSKQVQYLRRGWTKEDFDRRDALARMAGTYWSMIA